MATTAPRPLPPAPPTPGSLALSSTARSARIPYVSRDGIIPSANGRTASTALSSPATLANAAAATPTSGTVSIKGVYQDTNYNCVPASSSVSIGTFGVSVSQDTLAKQMGTTTAGTYDTTALPVINNYINPLGYSTWDTDTTGSTNNLLDWVAYDVSTLKRAPKLGVWMEKLPWNKGLSGHFGHAIAAYGYNRTASTITVWDPWKPTGGTHTLAASTLNAAMQAGGLSYLSGHSDADLSNAGDLTGDGLPDMVAVNRADGGLYLYTATGTSFEGGSNAIKLSTGWNAMTELTGVGDLTGDGQSDLVAVQKSTGQLWLFPGPTPSGSTRILIGTSGWNSMRELTGIGDVTGDGHPDLLAIDSSGTFWLYPGKTGGFGTRQQIGTGWTHMRSLAYVGDLTGDGKADFVADDSSTGKLWLYSGNTFSGTARTLIGTSGWNSMRSLAGFGDLTGDGIPDLLAVDNSTGLMYLYPGRAGGGLGTRTQAGSGWNG